MKETEAVLVDVDEVVGRLSDSMVRSVRLNGARQAARLHVAKTAAPASA